MPFRNISGEFSALLDDIVTQVYNGEISGRSLHQGLYNATAAPLIEDILKELNPDPVYDSPRNAMNDYLQNNIFAFAAAKTFTQYREFGQMLTDENGEIRSRAQFRTEVEKLFIQYNDHYLNVERENAISRAQMAEKWQSFTENSDVAPQWEYRTAGDNNVRPDHAQLEGLILDLNDPQTDKLFPPLDFGCRCTAVQLHAPTRKSPPDKVNAAINGANINPYFAHNPGKSWVIYEDKHPYFKGMPNELKAVEHYGMKRPAQIYRDREKLPGMVYGMDEPEQLAEYWADMIKQGGTPEANEFIIDSKPLNGLKVTFDNDFYKHLQKDRSGIFKLFHNAPDVIARPDEVFCTNTKQKPDIKKLTTHYIKYFAENPLIITTETGRDGKIKATGIKEVPPPELDKYRKGILRFKTPVK